MAHFCVPQNQALGVCRGFVPDIQVCGTHGREDLVNVTITSNAEEEMITNFLNLSASLSDVLFPRFLFLFLFFPDQCPFANGYWVFEERGHCLKVYSSPATFNDVSLTCTRDGGHLYKVTSTTDMEVLADPAVRGETD